MVRRRDLAAELLAGFLWGALATVLGMLVVSGFVGRFVGLLLVFDPATGAPLPALVSLAGGVLGAWWRYSFAVSGSGNYADCAAE